MKTPYSDSEVMQVLTNYPEFTLADAISYLNECYDEYHDPEGDQEICDLLDEREMESHLEHIRTQGGDYWVNDAGEPRFG
jgi:pyrroloquinoline quinone (PQQ) biosynthesis protein C